jgi:hypothetical protein
VAWHRLWQSHQACAAPVDHTADKLGERGKVYYITMGVSQYNTTAGLSHFIWTVNCDAYSCFFQQFFLQAIKAKETVFSSSLPIA